MIVEETVYTRYLLYDVLNQRIDNTIGDVYKKDIIMFISVTNGVKCTNGVVVT